ncbi:hyaluronidase PH-20-like isoform X2 [Erinaceus europaeus]|uniref:Hyaluronidase n=1 Tax=Erinaceus europaeus TaxID=9365 RepID=A0ABM3XUJ9_ERIEU|nr:hyaluronidase PH-20-like isoform X2 [Erinaceus europaeus]
MKIPKFLGRNIQVHQSYSTMGMLGFTSVFFRSLVGFSGPFQAMFAFFLFPICFTRNFRAAPLLTNTPYIWAWNAPSVLCDSKFNVPIDLSLFSFIGNPQKNVIGQNVTIFYMDRLGYYPYINTVNHTDVNGGIPQVGSLQKHLVKAKDDILYYMPQDKLGLAVIDWEEWRPIWARNWKPKDIYQQKSIELVLQNNVQLSEEEATKIAKVDFEKAARDFMQETLKVGKSLRPKHLWGYYLFPNCYNYNYNEPSYNGSCPDIEKSRNNELFWLWEESTALYPSIYLNDKLTSSPEAILYVRNRIQETIRISEVLNAQDPLPIFVYARPVFSGGSGEYLSQADLVSTIGESIALGASGIVMWGSLNLSQSMVFMSSSNLLTQSSNKAVTWTAELELLFSFPDGCGNVSDMYVPWRMYMELHGPWSYSKNYNKHILDQKKPLGTCGDRTVLFLLHKNSLYQ